MDMKGAGFHLRPGDGITASHSSSSRRWDFRGSHVWQAQSCGPAMRWLQGGYIRINSTSTSMSCPEAFFFDPCCNLQRLRQQCCAKSVHTIEQPVLASVKPEATWRS